MKSDMPAVMMEPVLMSNPAEAAVLVERTDGDYCPDYACRRGQIAQALYQGVLDYMGGAGPGGALHVVAIEMSYSQKGPNYIVSTGVTIRDGDGNFVSGAAVSLDKTLDGTSVYAGTVTTGDDSTAHFQVRVRQTGTFVSAVTGVHKDGWTYDLMANVMTSQLLNVP
jgi:hypothetical protein